MHQGPLDVLIGGSQLSVTQFLATGHLCPLAEPVFPFGTYRNLRRRHPPAPKKKKRKECSHTGDRGLVIPDLI